MHMHMREVRVEMNYGLVVEGPIELAEYGNRTTALMVDGEVMSINLQAYGLVPPNDMHIYVKDYSEHAGLADQLVAAGVVEKLELVPCGYGTAWLCRILSDEEVANKS